MHTPLRAVINSAAELLAANDYPQVRILSVGNSITSVKVLFVSAHQHS
jgi:hypothetical protein